MDRAPLCFKMARCSDRRDGCGQNKKECKPTNSSHCGELHTKHATTPTLANTKLYQHLVRALTDQSPVVLHERQCPSQVVLQVGRLCHALSNKAEETASSTIDAIGVRARCFAGVTGRCVVTVARRLSGHRMTQWECWLLARPAVPHGVRRPHSDEGPAVWGFFGQ